jgi:hypothetical protein
LYQGLEGTGGAHECGGGAVIGYAFESKGFSRVDIDTNESDPVYSLAGQLTGMPLKPLQGFGIPAEWPIARAGQGRGVKGAKLPSPGTQERSVRTSPGFSQISDKMVDWRIKAY